MPLLNPAGALAADEGVANGIATTGPDNTLSLELRWQNAVYCGTVASNASMLLATRPDGSPVQPGDYLDNTATGATFSWTYQGDQHGSGHSNINNWHQGNLAGAAVAGVSAVADGGIEIGGTASNPTFAIDRVTVDEWYADKDTTATALADGLTNTDVKIDLHGGDAPLTVPLTLADLRPGQTLTITDFGNALFPYVAFPAHVDTLVTFLFRAPQSLQAADWYAMVAKAAASDTNRNVVLAISSFSDGDSQTSPGDTGGQAPQPLLATTYTLPAGSSVAIRQAFNPYLLSTAEPFDPTASIMAVTIARLGSRIEDTYAQTIAFGWPELRGTRDF